MEDNGVETNKKRKMETVETDDSVDKEDSVQMYKKYKMKTDDEPAKIVLISNVGSRYEVDKDLLLRSSDYFQALVNSGMSDAHFKELTLECLSDAYLQEVNNFLSNVQSNEEYFGARDLCCVERGLVGSLYLQIESMTDKYLNCLFGLLNESTYARILQFANKFVVFQAIEKVFEFIFDNLKYIVSTSEILSLSPEDMIRLVESEVVNVGREFDIFDLVVRWTSVDESRRQYAELLFSKVRYNLMAVDDKKKASELLNELQINVQTEGHGFRTVGAIFAFGALDIEVIQQPCYSLSTYDFLKTLTNKTTEFPFVSFKPNRSRMETESFLSCYSVCAANNRIYFAGGLDEIRDVKLVKVYDIITSKWSRLSDMNVERCNFYFGEMGGHLYAVAGDTVEDMNIQTVERYIPDEDRFYMIAPQPIGDTVENMNIQTVEKYIPDEDRWYMMAPLPIVVSALSGTVCNGMLYVSGGCNGDDEIVNQVHMYNPALNQWSEKAPMLTARFDHTMTALGDKIFVVGGMRHRRVNNGEMFDCTTEQWTSVFRMKEHFFSPESSILINSSLYCFEIDTSQDDMSIQEISLRKYLDGNKSPSNALSDLATKDELKKKPSNVTDDDDSDMEDGYHFYEYPSTQQYPKFNDRDHGGYYTVVYSFGI